MMQGHSLEKQGVQSAGGIDRPRFSALSAPFLPQSYGKLCAERCCLFQKGANAALIPI